MKPIVVVGASLAGMSAVQAMRGAGFDGAVVVLDGSRILPSDRPPLSKQVLSGEWELERAVQRVARELDTLSVDLRLGVRAEALDVSRRTLELSDGSTIAAAGIVVATGSIARTLPPPTLGGVHVVRTGADCLGLRDDLDRGPARVVVVGAGFIGAEVAATCRRRGLEVTMIEAAATPLERVLPEPLGQFVANLHRAHGVDVRLGTGIEGLVASGGGRVGAVRLSDGSAVEAEVVVVGIGAAPAVDWLAGSGLDVLPPAQGGGVRCDATLLAAPGIVAAGDIAAWPNPRFGGELMRVEHWENAVEQGTHAGRRLLAELPGPQDQPGEPFDSVPWFWSDQYDAKIQMVGRASPGDEVVVVDGGLDEDRFVALLRRGAQCRAVVGVNRAKAVMQARMRLAEALDWQPVADLFA